MASPSRRGSMDAGKVIIAPVWGPNMATAESRIFTFVRRVHTVQRKTEIALP
jgi:hypothetical protein